MGRNEKTRQIILRLKEVKMERNLSDPQIHRMVTDKGYVISLSSVVRVFAEGSEDRGFRYEDTIQPIAATLLETDAPPRDVEGAEATETEALRQLVQLKNAILEEKEKQISYLKNQVEFKESRMQQMDTLLAERRDFIYDKDKTIAELKKEVKSLQRLKSFLVIVIILLLLMVITALLIDKLDPNVGFFWLDDVSAFFNSNGLIGSISSGWEVLL